MRIVHIGLSDHYTDGMTYQENILPLMNIQDGHEVIFISDIYRYENGELVQCGEEDIVLESGLRLIRIKYDRVISEFVTRKIQKAQKIKRLLEELRPDIIFYHNLCGYELLDVAAYADKQDIPLYADSHADFLNTARNIVSRTAYKLIHGNFIKHSKHSIKKIYYISEETKEFLRKLYGVEEEKLELMPLGGIVQTVEAEKKQRQILMERYHFPQDVIIYVHSGKLVREKKTKELLEVLSEISNDHIRLLVFGSIPKEYRTELMDRMKADSRVYYLGWKSGDEIIDILNGTDVYLQPGTASATSQIALCCGCAEIIAPTKSYKALYEDAVDFANNSLELKRAIEKFSTDRNYLEARKKDARRFAQEKLDYKKIARKYLV